MPRANPESTFEVAARHLFRHITDMKSLRYNPLVRAMRVGAENGGADPAVLLAVHGRILKAARALCKDYAAAGSKIRADRQYAIVVGLCDGEAAADTAARLGLSRRQYYRERRTICLRVSRALVQPSPGRATRFEMSDPLRLLLARAEALLDQGFARRAVGLLDEARASLPEGVARSAVQLRLADALLSLGLAARAERLLTESSVDADTRTGGDPTSRWLYDHQRLVGARLAIETGRNADAGRALESLARRRFAEQEPDEETLDTLVECGNWYCQSGKFSHARNMLDRARDVSERLPRVAAHRQIAVTLLAAHCAEDSIDEFGLEHHWLSEALALSISNGSACGMLDAMNGLMGYYVSTGRDDDVYALAEESLCIAQGAEGTRILADVGIEITTMMLRTRYWRTVDPLLFEVEKLAQPGTLRWAVLKHLQGNFLMRAGRYDDGRAALAEAYDAARSVRNRRLESIVLRDLAIVLHHVGSVTEGIEFMRHAVELAEGYAGVWSLWNTYEAAARLLTDRRIARLARQARAAISARAHATPGVEDHALERERSVRARRPRHSTGARPRLTIGKARSITRETVV
jgi:tetratricopeptide (TPR) repeat protein